jgi:ATP-binding cassette, subfamily G (WHITE), member 2
LFSVANFAIEDHGDAILEVEQQPVQSSLAFKLSEKYLNSTWSQSVNDEINPVEEAYIAGNQSGHNTMISGEYSTGFLTQLRYVSKRTILNLVRNPQTSMLQLVIVLFFALIVGVIYLQLDDNVDSAIQNRVGAFFFIIMNQVFGNLSAVELFIKERSIFVHESASGFYRVSAYFFAKVFCDLVPMRLVPLSAFCVITYFMIGLQTFVDKFFIYYLSLFLTTMAASAIGFCVGASVRVFAIANLLIALCYVIMMVFGGLLVNLNTMADWLSWLQYLSIIRYCLNVLSINELKDLDVYSYVNDTKILIENAGINYLDKQGIPHETAWDLWQNVMALGLITIGIMLLAYIQLRRIPKLK